MKSLIIATTAGLMAHGAILNAQTHSQNDTPNAPMFVATETLLDATITNEADQKHKADVDDFIVDSRTGRILYAIVDTNGILGSQNKVIALPYGALSWNATERNYRLNASAAQIANLPACDPDDWDRFQDSNWFSTLRGIFGDRQEFRDAEKVRGDEYTSYFTDKKTQSVKGKVIGVNRDMRTSESTNCYAVLVKSPDDDQQYTVVLAPVDFINQHTSSVPKEGSDVTIKTVTAYNAKGEKVWVAQSVECDGKTLQLRDDKGVPVWQSQIVRGSQPFYLRRASKMASGSLMAQGEEFGSVNETVMEPYSGTTAFVVISVGGVLGIDDTLYPIPSGAVTAGPDHDLYIDMSVSKIRLAPKLSGKGVNDLNNAEFASSVYKFYGTSQRQFQLDRSSRWNSEERQADRH